VNNGLRSGARTGTDSQREWGSCLKGGPPLKGIPKGHRTKNFSGGKRKKLSGKKFVPTHQEQTEPEVGDWVEQKEKTWDAGRKRTFLKKHTNNITVSRGKGFRSGNKEGLQGELGRGGRRF